MGGGHAPALALRLARLGCSRMQFAHWQAVTALDVVTEVLLVAYSGWAVSTVQIASRKKLMVFLALGCRIVLIPLSALRLYYLKHQLSSQYPTLLGAYTTTTTEIYLSLSIDGISYTDRYARSAYKSKSGTGVSTDSEGNTNRNFSYSYKHSHAGGDRARLVSDAHNEEGPSSSGLQILRSVQWSVVDEAIELDETTRPPAAAQPVYQSLRY
ncbi:predicted protein [Aspergillus nidulans FGSC A4]|uniref:Integral membrane protein n=1 Tax=Emericella nidulans (strain FGSC A4 / ATCC 38163 / CBS 112.46 / NRRL 194 / M139) TaxID=227321 RepID=Q5B827_EMENI|nr:hypothetical protein [Aspergillus nidulans FGSC A4]EAA63271.1 predicted protein [Aspergillus nidulans FGSC A4]CBF82996.1 TPA: conserved hypothetical protein [Aspergillus nidulans FGSC A4]|eukprot:XP_660907.1 predicted protein [Aspergillus nidulans FGSC A4]